MQLKQSMCTDEVMYWSFITGKKQKLMKIRYELPIQLGKEKTANWLTG